MPHETGVVGGGVGVVLQVVAQYAAEVEVAGHCTIGAAHVVGGGVTVAVVEQ